MNIEKKRMSLLSITGSSVSMEISIINIIVDLYHPSCNFLHR